MMDSATASSRWPRPDRVILAIGVALLFASSISAAQDPGPHSVTQGEVFEFQVRVAGVPGNPFDIDAVAEVRGAAGRVVAEPRLFMVDRGRYAFRFYAAAPGAYSFAVSSSQASLNGATGRLTVIASRDQPRGFVGAIGNKWGWTGTGQVFVPQLVMAPGVDRFARDASLAERVTRTFITDHGFNGIHIPSVAGHWFNIEQQGNKVTRSMTDPDPRTFEALERVIRTVHEAGGMVHIWAWGDQQRGQTPKNLRGGINGEIDQRIQRYIAARLGAVPGWTMGYGFDLNEWVKASELAAWHDAMHKALAHPHLLGGRPGPTVANDNHGPFKTWNRPLDYISYQHHRPSFKTYLAAMAGADRPVFSEDRFRIRNRSKDYEEEDVRRGLYHSTMAGGCANIWGNLRINGDRRRIADSYDMSQPLPNRHWVQTYNTFFHERGRFVQALRSAPKVSQMALTAGSGSVIVYVEDADEATMDLSGIKAGLRVVAVDTRKAYAEVELGRSESGRWTVKLPSKSDWVIAVGRFGNAP